MRKESLKKLATVVFGLVIFSFGDYFLLLANIGLDPWNCLSDGVSVLTGLPFGRAHVCISCTIVIIDLLIKEKIGWGTILDALMVGTLLDVFKAILPFKEAESFFGGVVLMIIGLLIMALGQYFYIKAGLSAGPRDCFLVGLGKRMRKLPIGAVQIIIQATVFVIGWLLGGRVGIGTLIPVVAVGGTQQLVFNLMHFEPRDVISEDFITTLRKIITDK